MEDVIVHEQIDNKHTFYRDGKFDGEIVEDGEGFKWRNSLAIETPCTRGVAETLGEACAQLGYQIVTTKGRYRLKGSAPDVGRNQKANRSKRRKRR